ncbi:hypothetical protein Tco_0420853, partial [Tanacetum coccineum]
MCTDSSGRPSYARAMVELQIDVELKDNLVVVAPKFADGCPKKIVSGVLKNLKKPSQAGKGVQNGVSSSGTKKQAKLTRKEANTYNQLDVLNTVDNDDELGTNGGNSKLAKKGDNFDVVSSAYGDSSKAFGSPNTTPLAARINDLERQMLDEKLVLVDDDGNPLKNINDSVNANSDSEVDEVFNKTASFMASTSSKDTSTSGSDDPEREYAMTVRNFKKFFRRKAIGDVLKSHLATKIKRPSLEVLGVIAKMKR